jgi:tagaturonate epimerase
MADGGRRLGKYSVGVGDRFGRQAKAQLQACAKALESGLEIEPVWNKSNREHVIIGSEPSSVRQAADAAVKALGWNRRYFCDADHITAETVGRYLDACDFFTMDVADFIGQAAPAVEIESFVERHGELKGRIELPEADGEIEITGEKLRETAQKFLAAVKRAGVVYRVIENAKGKGAFISEVSMDETDRAQSPAELLIILAAIADEGIPVETIAPKFSGRFNKGVDYEGDTGQFEREMALDVAAIALAVREYGLPGNLKLSIHSGSDKFSIYPAIYATMKRFNVGVHLKTAGTTWLEELIGLAEAGGSGLALAKEIYAEALAHREELCAPYAAVIDIDAAKLPSAAEVQGWTSEQYTAALRHVRSAPAYNPSLRQLLHVGFKVAAKMGRRYLDLVEVNEAVIAKNVTENLCLRHIAPVFLGTIGEAVTERRAPEFSTETT